MKRILLAGSSGFIGMHLSAYLREAGNEVCRLVRYPELSAPDCILWNPADGIIERERLEGFDAVINLAGAPLMAGRWNTERKHAIWASRVTGTRLLAGSLLELDRPPRTLLNASAIGYYGDRGEKELREGDEPGKGFLANVCRTWEDAAMCVERKGLRLALMRFGLVLGHDGGALKAMLKPFRLGMGGRLGDGMQFVSWIAMDDLLRAVEYLLEHESMSGPVNMVGPNPIRQGEFSAALARELHRPHVAHAPAWVLRLALGEVADEVLLASTRVQPGRLASAGFEWQYADVERALKHLVPF